MRRGQHAGRQRRGDPLAAAHGDPEALAEQRLRRGGAEADQDPGLDALQLGLQPGAAGLDLDLVRLAVNAALPRPALPLEVLHHVGDVGPTAVDSRRLQGLVEQLSRRADEGMSLPVLAVAGLLPHQHQLCAGRALAEHRLGRPGVEVAALAGPGRLPEGGEPTLHRHPGRGTRLPCGRRHLTTVCTLAAPCRPSSGTVCRRTLVTWADGRHGRVSPPGGSTTATSRPFPSSSSGTGPTSTWWSIRGGRSGGGAETPCGPRCSTTWWRCSTWPRRTSSPRPTPRSPGGASSTSGSPTTARSWR